MGLQEVVEKFTYFGFDEAYVRYTLAQGDSPFNAYEGLKAQLQACFEGLPVEAQNTLRDHYSALMALRMVNRVVETPEEEKKEKKAYTAPVVSTAGVLMEQTFEAFLAHMKKCDGQRCKELVKVYDEMFTLCVEHDAFPEGVRPFLTRLGYLPVVKEEGND